MPNYVDQKENVRCKREWGLEGRKWWQLMDIIRNNRT